MIRAGLASLKTMKKRTKGPKSAILSTNCAVSGNSHEFGTKILIYYTDRETNFASKSYSFDEPLIPGL